MASIITRTSKITKAWVTIADFSSGNFRKWYASAEGEFKPGKEDDFIKAISTQLKESEVAKVTLVGAEYVEQKRYMDLTDWLKYSKSYKADENAEENAEENADA